jgi:hypothetical protein
MERGCTVELWNIESDDVHLPLPSQSLPFRTILTCGFPTLTQKALLRLKSHMLKSETGGGLRTGQARVSGLIVGSNVGCRFGHRAIDRAEVDFGYGKTVA